MLLESSRFHNADEDRKVQKQYRSIILTSESLWQILAISFSEGKQRNEL